MSYDTLICANDLRDEFGKAGNLVILDAGFDLADTGAGERAHAQGHLPGARYAHLDRDLSGTKTGRNGRHPLPDRAAFARTAGAWGIAPGTQVVAYDRQGGPYAARAWWLLRWLGHRAVAVLDGGFQAWQALDGRLETDMPTWSPQPPYPVSKPAMPTMEIDALMSSLGQVRLVDARAPERFRGETEPLDPQAGHIPGALNRFFKDNLGADDRFKAASQLHDDFAPLLAGQPAERVVHQCGSGVTACHNLLAMEVAGMPGSALYAGSWSEWSSDPSRPIAQG